MRAALLPATALLLALTAPAGALKPVKYPEVKVELPPAAATDPEFQALRTALNEAVAKKDVAALTALVGPTFAWTVDGTLAGQMDLGRDAAHNFRVAFGFREAGRDADSPVQDGPYWDALADLVRDPAVEKPQGTINLLCGPPTVVADNKALEQAQRTIQEPNENVDWYYTNPDTEVTASPGSGASLGKVTRIAVPVLEVHPTAPNAQNPPPPTHYKILLPSGRLGWVPVNAAQPLVSDRLCYAKTVDGKWRIGGYDQVEQDGGQQ